MARQFAGSFDNYGEPGEVVSSVSCLNMSLHEELRDTGVPYDLDHIMYNNGIPVVAPLSVGEARNLSTSDMYDDG